MQRTLAKFVLAALAMPILSFGAVQAAHYHQNNEKDIVETAVSAGSFKTLATALQKADLVEALKGKGPFTVFAPTDAAFAKLPKETLAELLKPENKRILVGILTYHVAPGDLRSGRLIKQSGVRTLNGQQIDLQVKSGKLNVDDATVVKADIVCSNGVIHVIDRVILPSTDDILTTAAKAGSFKTLATAIKTAGLVKTLQGKGPVTVFAPTDKAFAKLPKETLASLLQPENRSKLTAILKYHVVPGRKYAGDVINSRSLKTLQGSSIHVKRTDSGVRLNKAGLVATDIDASNGVIHVIDTVLLPPEKSTKAAPARARRMIANAINRGAPMYNSGHPHACMMIYRNTALHLLREYSAMVPTKVQSQLEHAVRMSRQTHHNIHNRAWALRHALDAAYRVMPPLEQ